MERLSEKAIEIINELHTERLDYNSEYLPLIDAANRLAAYEATGLEPEEVEIMRESKADAQFMLTELCRLCDYDRLEELARAEHEGRLVVLPCKVGEYVYIPNIEQNKVERVRVQGISISVSGRTILKFGGYPFESAWGDGCGKDWFLAREEAEEALEGGKAE